MRAAKIFLTNLPPIHSANAERDSVWQENALGALSSFSTE
jgi:hypothetical protein